MYLASNSSRKPGYSSGANKTFPASLLSSVVAWMNGDAQAFSDIAGTIPANIGDPVGRILESSPLVSNWQAPVNSQRPKRESNALQFDYFGSVIPGQQIQRAAIPSVPLNNATMLISFMPRDGVGSPQVGLGGENGFDVFAGSGMIAATYNAGTPWVTALNYLAAQQTAVVIRWTPTGLKASMLTQGVITNNSLAVAVTAGTSSAVFGLGNAFAAEQGFYGSIGQYVAFDIAVTDSETIKLLQWANSKALMPAFPLTARLYGIVGDSIARGTVGIASNAAWCWNSLKNIRATFPTAQMINVAIIGGGASPADYAPVIPFYSALRVRNTLCIAVGTNDLATGNSVPATLAALYNMCDTARLAGWRVALVTLLPRSGLFAGGVNTATYTAAMTLVNNDIIANWALHSDSLINTTTIVGMGGPGDSTNLTNYQADGVHPTSVGMALLEPVYTAGLLAA